MLTKSYCIIEANSFNLYNYLLQTVSVQPTTEAPELILPATMIIPPPFLDVPSNSVEPTSEAVQVPVLDVPVESSVKPASNPTLDIPAPAEVVPTHTEMHPQFEQPNPGHIEPTPNPEASQQGIEAIDTMKMLVEIAADESASSEQSMSPSREQGTVGIIVSLLSYYIYIFLVIVFIFMTHE